MGANRTDDGNGQDETVSLRYLNDDPEIPLWVQAPKMDCYDLINNEYYIFCMRSVTQDSIYYKMKKKTGEKKDRSL